jgi:hypothetical protein
VKGVLDVASSNKRVDWPGVENNTPPPQDDTWFRVSIKHDKSGQASLSGDTGKRRWRRNGWLNIQVFVPYGAGGLNRAMELACILRDAIQGTSTASDVWFRDVEAKEVGPDGNWYNATASARFTYDEVK